MDEKLTLSENLNQRTANKYFFGRFLLGLSAFVCVCLLIGIIFVYEANLPPDNFPTNVDIVVAEGATIRDVSDLLDSSHVVASSFLFYLLIETQHEEKYIQAGTYRFPQELTSVAVAHAVTSGEYLSPNISITFPEGFSAKNILNFLPQTFQKADFSSALSYEGFLFPDTYFISPQQSPEEIINLLRATYTKKVGFLIPEIDASGFTEREIITLASIVEREANDTTSRRMVAGILRNRLLEQMPLQVDAAFEYILGKESSELTAEDLTMDSPYNTYENLGLPPTPISNPGLDAIEAVLKPTESEFLYYLTGDDGTFHYAKTFEEHKKNKVRYLR